MDRYIILNSSKSAHCCFTHTVMDSTKPDMIGDSDEQHEGPEGKHFETVCECFSREDAELVCSAMNLLDQYYS